MTIDFTTEHGQRIRPKLDTLISVWLTTVSPSGEPQPHPVWFVWEDDSFLIWTKPDSVRVRNLQANPKVSITIQEDDDHIEAFAVLNGTAEIDESIPKLFDHPAYMSKYEALWEPIGMTPKDASEEYNVRIRVRPTRMRGW